MKSNPLRRVRLAKRTKVSDSACRTSGAAIGLCLALACAAPSSRRSSTAHPDAVPRVAPSRSTSPPSPTPEQPPRHPIPDAVFAVLTELSGSDEAGAASVEVAGALVAAVTDPCGGAAMRSEPDVRATSASVDDGDELVVVLGPLCEASDRSLIAVIDRANARPFVRAARMDAISWPPYVDADGTIEVARRVDGPPWSKRTFERVRLRLDGDALLDIAPERFAARRVPAAAALRLARAHPTRDERVSILADVAALLGPDACEWDLDRLDPPSIQRAAVDLDDDPAPELAVLLPDACIAPHGGEGVLLLLDRGPDRDALTLADARFSSYVARPLFASSRSKTILVEEWARWGSHENTSELTGLRVDGGELRVVFSIPAKQAFHEVSPARDLSFRLVPAGDGFVVHYRGEASVFGVAEMIPELAGSVLDRPQPYRILEFRARVRYVWNDVANRYDRTSSGVSAEAIEIFTAHGADLAEDAEPWLPYFLPQLERRARTDKGVALLVPHVRARRSSGRVAGVGE